MSCESHYELNIAERVLDEGPNNYAHFAKVQLGSFWPHVAHRMREFNKRFPAPDFQLELTHWNIAGKPIKPKEYT